VSGDSHVRAKRLIAQERVEGISSNDSIWLKEHLHYCANCEKLAREVDEGLRSLRGFVIAVPRNLASQTQFRVRLRTQELREIEPRRRLIWFACAMSWALGVASAPYVWKAFEWIGRYTGTPKIVWQIGFGLWWAVPALVAATVILLENARRDSEGKWTLKETSEGV